jgi:hypothetical protein
LVTAARTAFETLTRHPLPADLTALPRVVLAARESLRQAGVSGPYALVLGADLYDQVLSTVHDGYPLPKQSDQIIDRPIVRATAIDAGVVLSVRGNDYELWLGQDLSIGYAFHDKHEIELYLTESFTFRVIEPAAAVRLAPCRSWAERRRRAGGEGIWTGCWVCLEATAQAGSVALTNPDRLDLDGPVAFHPDGALVVAADFVEDQRDDLIHYYRETGALELRAGRGPRRYEDAGTIRFGAQLGATWTNVVAFRDALDRGFSRTSPRRSTSSRTAWEAW